MAPHDADLDRLRADGWPQHDPVRWHFIEALARRAAACDGALQQRLNARVTALLADYGAARNARQSGSRDEPARAYTPTPLTELLHHISTHVAPAAELQTVQRLQGTWSRLAADQRVVRSRVQLQDNAGPLNSQRLVHRALMLMHDLAPDYLERFVAYADALLWLERAGGGDPLASKDVLLTDTGKGSIRRKVAKRKA